MEQGLGRYISFCLNRASPSLTSDKTHNKHERANGFKTSQVQQIHIKALATYFGIYTLPRISSAKMKHIAMRYPQTEGTY